MAKFHVIIGGRVYADSDIHTQFDRVIAALATSPINDAEMEATPKSRKFSITGWIEAEDRDAAMDVACAWEAEVENGQWVEMTVGECELL